MLCVKSLDSMRKQGIIISHWTVDGEVYFIKKDESSKICRVLDYTKTDFF